MSETTLSSELEQQLEELDAIRRRVLNVVGHALWTPMATLGGLVEVLAQADDEDTRGTVTPALVRQTRRLERLLDDVLVASDVTTRLPPEEPELLHPTEVAVGVWHELEQSGDALVSDGADQRAWVGREQLRWMLRHLLDNAVKYGEDPTTVRVRRDGDRARVDVDSPGPQLPPSDIENATQLFYRGERAVISSASGMGVGLTVVAQLAEHAGGRLEIEARDGGGVVSSLDLPAEPDGSGEES